jgi:hypothetical protein
MYAVPLSARLPYCHCRITPIVIARLVRAIQVYILKSPPTPTFPKLSVSHIFYWTRGNVVNHVKVKLFSHTHCEEPPLSVIARSPLLVCFRHTLRTGDEAISLLMRKR